MWYVHKTWLYVHKRWKNLTHYARNAMPSIKRIAYCVRQRTDHWDHSRPSLVSGWEIKNWWWNSKEKKKERLQFCVLFLLPPINNRKELKKKKTPCHRMVSALHCEPLVSFVSPPYIKKKRWCVPYKKDGPSGIEASWLAMIGLELRIDVAIKKEWLNRRSKSLVWCSE